MASCRKSLGFVLFVNLVLPAWCGWCGWCGWSRGHPGVWLMGIRLVCVAVCLCVRSCFCVVVSVLGCSVLVWFVFQTWGIVRTNRELIMGTKVYPKEDRYEFKQVAILELTYIVNFGSELAVVSMLPTFFETTFDLPKATAGILASCFAFVNLVARPAGGLISDKLGLKVIKGSIHI